MGTPLGKVKGLEAECKQERGSRIGNPTQNEKEKETPAKWVGLSALNKERRVLW